MGGGDCSGSASGVTLAPCKLGRRMGAFPGLVSDGQAGFGADDVVTSEPLCGAIMGSFDFEVPRGLECLILLIASTAAVSWCASSSLMLPAPRQYLMLSSIASAKAFVSQLGAMNCSVALVLACCISRAFSAAQGTTRSVGA